MLSVLTPYQYGFRPNHSTITAISLLKNDIVLDLDNRQTCAALFVNLSKAFDTVVYSLLLDCLSRIGLSCPSCLWFENSLSDTQIVFTHCGFKTSLVTLHASGDSDSVVVIWKYGTDNKIPITENNNSLVKEHKFWQMDIHDFNLFSLFSAAEKGKACCCVWFNPVAYNAWAYTDIFPPPMVYLAI